MKKLKVFCSYSHADAKLLDKLDGHMASLRRSLAVDTWTDGMIKAGSDWRNERRRHVAAGRSGVRDQSSARRAPCVIHSRYSAHCS